jgi:ATP-dependent Lon protease
MELIEVPGYTRSEKVRIAKEFLVKKQMNEHGLTPENLLFTDEGIQALIDHYTREAGVRGLEREIAAVCRNVTVKLVEGAPLLKPALTAELVEELLGSPRFHPEQLEHKLAPGVAVGIAVTPSGGDLLFIEATQMPGKGRIRVTGSMRTVMAESAHTAVSYARSKSDRLGLDPEWLKKIDLHLHIPRGGGAQDVASSGVAMFVAVASLLLDASVRSDVAVTGEITLRGRVLPISNVKSVVLAAHRGGIREILLPARNARDLEEVPAEVLSEVSIHLVERVDEVLPLVLEAPPGDPEASRSTHSPSSQAHP